MLQARQVEEVAEIAEREKLMTETKLRIENSGQRERSFAKVTKLLNRLKRIGEENSALAPEFEKLDLTMYLEETNLALAESLGGLKLRDTWKFLQVVVSLCQNYPTLLPPLQALLARQSSEADWPKRRIGLRISTEVNLLFPGNASALLALLVPLTQSEDPQALTTLAGWASRFLPNSVPLEISVKLRESVSNYFKRGGAEAAVHAAHAELAARESAATKQRLLTGAVTVEVETKIKEAKAAVDKTLLNASTLAALLSINLDVTPVQEPASPATPPPVGAYRDDEEMNYYEQFPTPDPAPDTDDESLIGKFLKQFSEITTAQVGDKLGVHFLQSGLAVNKSCRRRFVRRILAQAEFSNFSKSALTPAQLRCAAICLYPVKEACAFFVTEIRKAIAGEKETPAIFRYLSLLSEFTKFRVAPEGHVIELLEGYLEDSSLKSIELAAALCQSCGRCLLSRTDTCQIFDALLEKLMRSRSVKNYPLKIDAAIEDAYYSSKPKAAVVHVISPEECVARFARHLLWQALPAGDADEHTVARIFMKMPDAALRQIFLDLDSNVNFAALDAAASVLSIIAKKREAVVIGICDLLLEDIQSSMEKEDARDAPRRYRQVALLGELYNFKLISAQCILDCLFHFLGVGSSTQLGASDTAALQKLSTTGLGSIGEDDEQVNLVKDLRDARAPPERPKSFLRAKLACKLLNVAGFWMGKSRGCIAPLTRFCFFFDRYLLLRAPLPSEVSSAYAQAREMYLPRAPPPAKTLAEADAALFSIVTVEDEPEPAPAATAAPVEDRPRKDFEEEAFDKEMAELLRESISEGMQRRNEVRVLRAPTLRTGAGDGFVFLSRNGKTGRALDLPDDHVMLKSRASRDAAVAEEEQERLEIKAKILSNPEYGGRRF